MFSRVNLSKEVHEILRNLREETGADSFDGALRAHFGLPYREVVVRQNKRRSPLLLDTLNVGDEVVIPWVMDGPNISDNQRAIHNAVDYQQRQYGRKFTKTPEAEGIRVRRTL